MNSSEVSLHCGCSLSGSESWLALLLQWWTVETLPHCKIPAAAVTPSPALPSFCLFSLVFIPPHASGHVLLFCFPWSVFALALCHASHLYLYVCDLKCSSVFISQVCVWPFADPCLLMRGSVSNCLLCAFSAVIYLQTQMRIKTLHKTYFCLRILILS